MKNILLLLFLLVTIAASPCLGEEYRLSMLPRYFPEKLTAMITPLSRYLSEKTGHRIVPVLTDNFAQYETSLLNGTIRIGYENPLVYVNVSRVHEVLVTAIKGRGGDRFRGIIIARPDSGITAPADLKHKRIMIVGKTSAGGYLSQKIALAGEGLDVDRDCDLSVAADNRQENVIISVAIGDVDAGFIRESALHKADRYIIPGSIGVVYEAAWLPNWAFSVDRDLPAGLKKRIKTALLELDSKSKVLQAMGLSGFKEARDSDYDVMRKFSSR
ncbi:MAG TPA: phosphate/phosphite/phosphonate ABC transporter substrate-binding protein [Desulfobulbus sp.]|nr:phosphate/phosphite/phosphonate ABC transporter substrate-binding protein [Desulfobulbus sp.]